MNQVTTPNGERYLITSPEEAIDNEMPVWQIAQDRATGEPAILFLCGHRLYVTEHPADTPEDRLPWIVCRQVHGCDDKRIARCRTTDALFADEGEDSQPVD